MVGSNPVRPNRVTGWVCEKIAQIYSPTHFFV
jgi:hypothetical protein